MSDAAAFGFPVGIWRPRAHTTHCCTRRALSTRVPHSALTRWGNWSPADSLVIHREHYR